jgi:hypothetical protein
MTSRDIPYFIAMLVCILGAAALTWWLSMMAIEYFSWGRKRRGNGRKPIFQERTETGIPLVFVGIARLHDYRLSLRATLGLKAKK